MKKRLVVVFILWSLILMSYGTAAAFENSGEFIGMFNGNDPFKEGADLSDMDDAIEKWFSNSKGITYAIDLEFYAKVDAPSLATHEGDGNLTVAYSDKTTGTWMTGAPIEFYSVKAGSQYRLYWVEGGAESGFWNTDGLVNKRRKQREISHLSTWINNSGNSQNSPVPEPATVVLLGAGLIAITGLRRKYKK